MELISTIYNIFKIPKSRRKVLYKPFRQGDIRHSLANINKIKKELGYKSDTNFKDSLRSTISWFISKHD